MGFKGLKRRVRRKPVEVTNAVAQMDATFESTRAAAHDPLAEQPERFLGVDGHPIRKGNRVKLYHDDEGEQEIKGDVLIWTDPVATAKYPGGIFRYRVLCSTSFGTARCGRAKLVVGHSEADDQMWQENKLDRMWQPWEEFTEREELTKADRKKRRLEKAKEKKKLKAAARSAEKTA